MKGFGSILVGLGVFFLLAGVLALAGPALRNMGINVYGAVTSVKGVLSTGALLLAIGLTMRRVAARRARTRGN
jgi:hypothetical protein